MNLFLRIMAFFLMIWGFSTVLQAIRERYHHAYYKIGKLKVPFWATKVGASTFIIGMGIYLLLAY